MYKKDLPTSIYRLIDPRSGDIRYIGKTINPKRRLWQIHSDFISFRMSDWLKDMQRQNTRAVMEIIETCSFYESAERERYWIEWHMAEGHDLVNKKGATEKYSDSTPPPRALR